MIKISFEPSIIDYEYDYCGNRPVAKRGFKYKDEYRCAEYEYERG
jgi:hypothetical protein